MIIHGDLSVDDRGTVSFVNSFDFRDVKRFYMIENHEKGFIRAWHGHEKETKYVYVTRGSIIVALWPMHDPTKQPYRVVLSAKRPQVFCIPAGNYNGFKTLTEGAQVIFYSTATLEESKLDDFRKSAQFMNTIWEIEQR